MRRAVLLSVLLLALNGQAALAEPLVEATPYGWFLLAGVLRQGDVDHSPDPGCLDAFTDMVLRGAFVPSSSGDRVSVRLRTVEGLVVRVLTAEEPTFRVTYVSPDSCVHLTVEGTAVADASPYALTLGFGLVERRLPA